MLGFKVAGQFSCQCEFILSSHSSLWRTNSLAKFPSAYFYVYLSSIRLDQVDGTPFPEQIEERQCFNVGHKCLLFHNIG